MSTLYRIDELRAIEAQARARLPAGTLMQRAGHAAASWIHAWLDARQAGTGPGSLLVLCGPGDNGGDGFVCATALQQLGHQCICWAPLPSASADSLAARRQWKESGGNIIEQLPEIASFDLVVDALLGIGAQRPLGDPFLGALRWAQARKLPIVALDVPSGLHADTGAWIGAVTGAPASQTLTFLGDKPGLHTLDGIQAAGAVRVETLGVETPATGRTALGQLNTPEQFGPVLRPRAHNCNKGDFGSVAIVGGAPGMVGAVLLAARAAIRLGAGKVFVDCIGAPELRCDPIQPELMFRSERDLPSVDVLVVGCGLGTDAPAQARMERALAHPGPAIFDADALNCMAANADLGARMRSRTAASVLTPHPGEAARLLGTDTGAVQQDRVRSALALAQQYRAIVVLKGAGSIIAEPSGRYAINPTGGPALASAGTGDVLAGMIGALLAQQAECAIAVRAAVWLHGRAADLHGADSGLTASEVAPLAARALAELRGVHRNETSA